MDFKVKDLITTLYGFLAASDLTEENPADGMNNFITALKSTLEYVIDTGVPESFKNKLEIFEQSILHDLSKMAIHIHDGWKKDGLLKSINVFEKNVIQYFVDFGVHESALCNQIRILIFKKHHPYSDTSFGISRGQDKIEIANSIIKQYNLNNRISLESTNKQQFLDILIYEMEMEDEFKEVYLGLDHDERRDWTRYRLEVRRDMIRLRCCLTQ